VFVKSRIKKGPFNVELLLAILLLSTAVSPLATTHELLFQPGPEVGEDAHVDDWFGDATYNDYYLQVFKDEPIREMRTYIEFVELEPYLGSGHECLTATLSLFWYTGIQAPSPWLHVYRAAGPWEEDTLAWNNQPGYTGDPCVYPGPVPSEPSWVDIDCVTEIVNGWLSGEYEHYGFVIRYADEEEVISELFYSSDNYHDEKPKLYIEYQCTGVEPASLGVVKVVYR